jgi:hypothetical protein
VNEFNDTDHRYGGLLVAGCIDDALEKGLNSVAAALGGNRDTSATSTTFRLPALNDRAKASRSLATKIQQRRQWQRLRPHPRGPRTCSL